jgi:hypothetical protein
LQKEKLHFEAPQYARALSTNGLFLRIFLKKPSDHSCHNKRSLHENWPKMFGICPSNKCLIIKNINGIFIVLSGVRQICGTKERNPGE